MPIHYLILPSVTLLFFGLWLHGLFQFSDTSVQARAQVLPTYVAPDPTSLPELTQLPLLSTTVPSPTEPLPTVPAAPTPVDIEALWTAIVTLMVFVVLITDFPKALNDLKNSFKKLWNWFEHRSDPIADPSREVLSGKPIEPFRRRIYGIRFDRLGDGLKDREDQIAELRRHLRDQRATLLCIVGRGGYGKTALVSKLCAEVECGDLRLSNGASEVGADAIIYVDCRGINRPIMERLLECFREMFQELLGSRHAEELTACWQDPARSPRERAVCLLSKLQSGCYLLVIDNFEDLLANNDTIADENFASFVDVCLAAPNALRLLVTSRHPVQVNRPEAVYSLPLDDGLPLPAAVALLRESVPDDRRGLRQATRALLEEVAKSCYGLPYSLKRIAIILSIDESLTLPRLLANPRVFNLEVRDNVAAEIYRLVTDSQRRVVEAMAIYNQPVRAEAIRYLLLPYYPKIDVDDCLRTLLRHDFLTYRTSGETYEIHPLDQQYAYEHIPDDGSSYTKLALHRRQAEYYLEVSRTALRDSDRLTSLQNASLAMIVADRIGDDLLAARACIEQSKSLNILQRFSEALTLTWRAYEIAERANNKLIMAHALQLRTGIEYSGNRDYRNLDLLDKAIGYFADAGDIQSQTGALYQKSWLAMRAEKWQLVEDALAETERLIGDLGEGGANWRPAVLQVWGEYYALRRCWGEAIDRLKRAREAWVESKNSSGICAATGWLGLALYNSGQTDEGLTYVKEALRIESGSLHSAEGASKWLHYLGEAFSDQGDYKRSLHVLWLSRDIRAEIGQAELTRTVENIDRIRTEIDGNKYDEVAREFRPWNSEFAEYSFLWGLGPWRKQGEPILVPQGESWEAEAIFNPAAWTDGTRVYLLYRAQGRSGSGEREGISRIGLATSEDGIHFQRNARWVVEPTEEYEAAGCEDPRVVRIDGYFYMTYTAYDGRVARVALAVSEDIHGGWRKLGPVFTSEQWDEWTRWASDQSIPRGWSKAGAILGEKRSGYYWMYFGDTDVWAAYSSDLIQWRVDARPVLQPRRDRFDSRLVEPGPPPISLPEGIWLGYNSADEGLRYAFGQALFEQDDPTKLIRRSGRPLLEPTMAEEMEQRDGKMVVFGEGLVRFKQKWLLYYGIADSSIGVAIADVRPSG